MTTSPLIWAALAGPLALLLVAALPGDRKSVV